MENSTPSVCVIGAGFSGLCAGVKLRTKLKLDNFTIIEENHEVGGTWLLHTYPKCGSDIPIHLYSFSFAQNPEWSSLFSRQNEILEYLKNVARKYDLYSNIKFNHQIRGLVWEARLKKWRVTVLNKVLGTTDELWFDIIIAGPGGLRIPNIPPEYKDFEGPVMHSSKWDSSVDLKDKVVGVVGSGTSAVQIIPGIVNKVKQLYSFQRRPAWVIPKPQCQVPQWIKTAFAYIPGLQRVFRSTIFWSYESGFPGFKKDTTMNKFGSWMGRTQLKRQIPDNAELREKLTPDYKFACKRIAPSNVYYPALTLPHVEVIRNKVTNTKGHSVITEDGKSYDIDILILATGYDAQDYFAPAKVFGQASEDILGTWAKSGPSHYLGIMANSAPNFFIIFGPNTAASHNSCIFPIECQVNWTMKVISRMMRYKAQVVEVKKFAEEKYMKKILKDLEGTVYGAYDCGSFFKNHLGVVTILYPRCLVSYWNQTRKVKFSDLEFY